MGTGHLSKDVDVASAGHGQSFLQCYLRDAGRGRDELERGHRVNICALVKHSRAKMAPSGVIERKRQERDTAMINKQFKTPMEACLVTDITCMAFGRRWAEEGVGTSPRWWLPRMP